MVPFSMTLTDSGFQGHGIFEVKYLKGLVGRQEVKCRTVGSEAPSDDTFNELGYVRQVRNRSIRTSNVWIHVRFL